jgi:hypothetical protein
MRHHTVPHGVDGFGLAAAPTFAEMALLTSVSGGGAANLIGGPAGASLGGMIPMHLLMDAFHAGPSPGLVARCRRDTFRS